MTFKKAKPHYRKRRKQKKTKKKQKKRKSKANKKRRKVTRKLKLKGGGLFDDMKDFIGMKKKPKVTDNVEKGNCPTTNDKIGNFFGRFRKGASDVAGAAKKAGDQALGEVKGMAKDAKDKATEAADNAKSTLMGKDNYTWEEMKKSYESGFSDSKSNKEKFDSLENLKHKEKKEEKKEEKDPKMKEVEISVDDEKPGDKDGKPDDRDDKDENPSDKDENPSDKDENPGDKDKNPSDKDDKLEDIMKLNTDEDSLFDEDLSTLETIDDSKLA